MGHGCQASRRWNTLHCSGFKRADRHTKLMKKNQIPSTSSSSRPVTDINFNTLIESNMKQISKLAGAYAGMTMDSDDEISESESDEDDESDEQLGCGHAFVAHASTTSSIYFDSDSSDDEAPAFCFLAKASRDQVSPKCQKAFDKNVLSENIVYAKLIKMANTQQDALQRLEETLRKSDGLLVEEMEKNQMLAEEHAALSSTFEDLSIRHDSLSVDYEWFSKDFLKRNQEFESPKRIL